MGDAKKSKTELDEFDNVFASLIKDLTHDGKNDEEIESAIKWFQRVCEYNVPHGKKNRGISVVSSLQILLGNKITSAETYVASVIGWCIEFLQAYFLVADDMMDESLVRRGRACWYKVDGVGLEAINDSFFLENAIYVLLKKYVKKYPYYVDILELFHETTLQTVIGQCLDMRTAETGGKVDFTNYTLKKYKAIVKWKTAFYSFYLPVACALHMAGISDRESHEEARKILLEMGEFFQIQDDYLDCYGEPATIGKVGTDIEDNKCGWLVVQALERVNNAQREVLEKNYARKDANCVAAVKNLYKELNIKQIYEDHEECSYKKLCMMIDSHSTNLPRELFHSFARKIYKRNK